jgi:hypothetical protein
MRFSMSAREQAAMTLSPATRSNSPRPAPARGGSATRRGVIKADGLRTEAVLHDMKPLVSREQVDGRR